MLWRGGALMVIDGVDVDADADMLGFSDDGDGTPAVAWCGSCRCVIWTYDCVLSSTWMYSSSWRRLGVACWPLVATAEAVVGALTSVLGPERASPAQQWKISSTSPFVIQKSTPWHHHPAADAISRFRGCVCIVGLLGVVSIRVRLPKTSRLSVWVWPMRSSPIRRRWHVLQLNAHC